MRKLALACASVAVVAGMAACAWLGRAAFKNPVVTLREVQVAGIGLTGGSLDVILNVYNPNHYRLDATHLTYKVALEGDSITLADGVLDNHFMVAETDSQQVRIPVNFSYAGIGAAGRSILNTGTVSYHVMGDITVGSTLGSFTLPYSSKGRFTTTGVRR
ncbi:MAG TPA: LEA type 2 family protein [Gemmatimonadaceae bacterium]|nr:LEA type 2 family protein [Gemmatimonadaceae bacterium]